MINRINTTSRSSIKYPQYGYIYNCILDPVIGSEIGKTRPVLIISNDINNEFANTVTVLPITGQPAKKTYPFEVSIPKGVGGLTTDSRVKADQIRTVDKSRIATLKGTIPSQYLLQVEKALKIHLNMK